MEAIRDVMCVKEQSLQVRRIGQSTRIQNSARADRHSQLKILTHIAHIETEVILQLAHLQTLGCHPLFGSYLQVCNNLFEGRWDSVPYHCSGGPCEILLDFSEDKTLST